MADLETLVRQAATIAREVTTPEALLADAKGSWVTETMAALKATKLTGLVVPTANGGMGQGLLALARISESLGTAYASAGLAFGMHCVGTAVIAAKATTWQKERYLEPIAAGAHITTLALSEAGTGAHFYFPQTPLIAVTADQYLVNGNKSFVTNGGHADSYVVSTLGASADAEPDQFSCILLDADAKGIEWQESWNGLGMRGNASCGLRLNNVHIPGRNILGERGDQLWYVFNVVAPYFLIAMAGTYLGVAQAAMDEAKVALVNRSYIHNGTNLAQVSLLQHRLGQLWGRVERTRQLVYHAARAGDSNAADAMLQILCAKAEVAGCCVDVVNEAMTLAGGKGYQHDAKLGLLLRDARAAHVMSPTTDLLYTWIGRVLLDQPIFSD